MTGQAADYAKTPPQQVQFYGPVAKAAGPLVSGRSPEQIGFCRRW
jgi:hypothetical protein